MLAQLPFNNIEFLTNCRTFVPTSLQRMFCFIDFRCQLGRPQLAALAACGFADQSRLELIKDRNEAVVFVRLG